MSDKETKYKVLGVAVGLLIIIAFAILIAGCEQKRVNDLGNFVRMKMDGRIGLIVDCDDWNPYKITIAFIDSNGRVYHENHTGVETDFSTQEAFEASKPKKAEADAKPPGM